MPGRWAERRGGRTVPPQARRSCASDLTPGAGYRRFPGPAGGLELQGGGGDGLEGDRLGLDADRGWRGRRPGPPPRKVAPRSRSPAGRREPARDSGPSVPRSGSAHRRVGPGGHAGAVPRRLRRPPCCDGRRAVRPRESPVRPQLQLRTAGWRSREHGLASSPARRRRSRQSNPAPRAWPIRAGRASADADNRSRGFAGSFEGNATFFERGATRSRGQPNSPWRKSSVFKWRTGRPDSAVARLWTANLAETAPRPARDRPTGRPTG